MNLQMELLSTVDVIKQDEELRLISHWLQNICRRQQIQTIQSVRTVSVAALKRVKVLTKTSIEQFDIIEKQHFNLILLDFTTLGVVWNMAKGLNGV
jgi:hypothetical protein